MSQQNWFVYFEDHHEGPFSIEELSEMVSQAKVNSESYVWKDGMADWEQVNDRTELKPLFESKPEISLSSSTEPSMSMDLGGGSQGFSLETKEEPQAALEPSISLEPTQIGTNTPAEPVFSLDIADQPAPMVEEVSVASVVAETPVSFESTESQIPVAQAATSRKSTESGVSVNVVPEALEATPAEGGITQVIDRTSEDSRMQPDDRTDRLSPKELKKAEKAAKKAQKKAEKEAKKEQKRIAMEEGHPGIRKYTNLFGFLVICGLLVFGQVGGYFDPFLNHPVVSPVVKSVSFLLRDGKKTIIDALRPALIQLTDKVPVLNDYINVLSQPKNMKDEDFKKLEEAASIAIEDHPTLAVEAAVDDENSALVYVTSNLPNGTAFDITIEGVPGTLLNRVSFFSTTEIIIQDRIGKSFPIRGKEGAKRRPPPKGWYIITAAEKLEQAPVVTELLRSYPVSKHPQAKNFKGNRKLISETKVFLGGEEDDTYRERLKEFNDKVRNRAAGERTEVWQFFNTIKSQAISLEREFSHLKRSGFGYSSKKRWDSFESGWTKLSTQMGGSLKNWTPSKAESEFVYYGLHVWSAKVYQILMQHFDLMKQYVSKPVTRKDFQKKYDQSKKLYDQWSVYLLKKLELADKAGVLPNGFPVTTGL